MKQIKTIYQFIGWVGVILILLAYALLSLGLLESNTLSYQIINLLGAIAIGIKTLSVKDYQPTVLQVVWGLIALIAIARIIL